MYCVHTNVRKLEVYEYDREDIREDLKFFKVKTVKELQNHDFRIFATEKAAEKFIEKYKLTENSLDTLPYSNSQKILYPRRFLVLAKMGVKLSTIRHYKKAWSIGSEIVFYDQTYYIRARLKKISNTSEGWKYEYAVL